jgi:hypothetical protein
VRLILLRVNVVTLPDVPRKVAEHCDEVMVPAPAGGGSLAKLAAAHDAPDGGAAPKRGAVIFDQATT